MRKVQSARQDFPQLQVKVHDRPLIYLDSAATTLKPRIVADVVQRYYSLEVANIHRGAHALGSEGTERFEAVRMKVAKLIGAARPEEIIFTRGTTEAINLAAESLRRSKRLRAGQSILLTEMEHHSNIVPWQILAQEVGLKIDFVRLDSKGALDLADFSRKIKNNVGVFAVTQASNVLGAINPVREMIFEARQAGSLTLVDAAQSVSWGLVNVQDIKPDLLAFSGHKIFGPTGIGVLYGHEELLKELPPYQGGGSMILEVNEQSSTYLPPPQKFEAGTPHIAGVLGLGKAIEYFAQFDPREIFSHERTLAHEARERLLALKDIRVFGPEENSSAIVSFAVGGAHPADVGQILDQMGIAVRAGHLCCQPLMRALGISGVVRASFSIYSSRDEIEALVQGVKKAKEMLL